jgi:hypothetical protein
MLVAMLPNTAKLCIAGEETGGDGEAVLQATVETRQGLEMKLGVALVVLMYSYIKLNRLAYYDIIGQSEVLALPLGVPSRT